MTTSSPSFQVDPDIRIASTLDKRFYLDESVFARSRERILRAAGSGSAILPTLRRLGPCRPGTCYPGTSTSRCCSRATGPGCSAACRTSARTAATCWFTSPAGPSRSAAAITRGASTSRAG